MSGAVSMDPSDVKEVSLVFESVSGSGDGDGGLFHGCQFGGTILSVIDQGFNVLGCFAT